MDVRGLNEDTLVTIVPLFIVFSLDPIHFLNHGLPTHYN